MTQENMELKTEKEELNQDDSERTRDCPCFVPRTDIYETSEAIHVVTDMPGVHEEAVDITLEKNVLSINGSVDIEKPEGYAPSYIEYDMGDYQRSFTLSNKIDFEGITANMSDGILHLTLPKVGPAQARKIAVSAG